VTVPELAQVPEQLLLVPQQLWVDRKWHRRIQGPL